MRTRRKVDLRRERAEEYAGARRPHVVRIARGRYLAVDGQGEPGGDFFQRAVRALYAMAYAIRRAERGAGRDFRVMPLEAQWWSDAPGGDLAAAPREAWRYRLMIRVPETVGDRHLAVARAALEASGRGEGVEAVELERIAEGRCVQALHVGPYEREQDTLERMRAAAHAEGLAFAGVHHEIYLSDPRRTAPARLRTLLRHPVRREHAGA